MLKIMKYLKKSAGWVLVILMLLGLRAYCDLALPQYTSNIVDVGIQQGGIEGAAPRAIRESEMKKLEIFFDEEAKSLVEESYTLTSRETLSDSEYEAMIKEYPELRSQPIYIRNSMSEEELDALDALMQPAVLAAYALAQQGMDPRLIPEEMLSEINVQIEERLQTLADSMKEQMSVSYVKAEYEAIGMDVNSIQTNYLWSEGLKMLGMALIAMIASVLVCLLASRVAASLGRDLRSQIFQKVVTFSNSEMDKFSTSSLITRSTNDIQQVQLVVVMLLRMILYAPILGIGGVVKVINTNTSMSWIIALAVVLVMLLVMVLMTVVMPKFKLMQKLVDRLNLVSREILTGLSVVRAFSREKYEEERFDQANTELTKTMLFTNRSMTLMMPMMMLIMNGITVLIVWVGAGGIDAGTLQVGDMMAFITYTMQIIMSFLMISMISIMLPRASVAAGRIDEVLTTEVSIKEKDRPKELPSTEKKKGVVRFNHVHFRYPGAESDVLHDIDFEARPGETTAFIGSTGSGKSTLVNLLPRLYDVTQGEITIDGVDVRDLSMKELRDQIGFVPQKGVLFSGTIASNLRFGNRDASDEEIRLAAKIAQAADFIEEKDETYDSPIAQGGANVSGGQKQRLSIARAIAKKPPVYVFDDSFSALDFKTDTALRKALHEHVTDSTILIVAQRVSTILHAEQIIVLDEGRIVGKGTHEELLAGNEVYRQIASSQLSEEELYGNKENIQGKEE